MANGTWTVKEMLDWCESYLASKGDEAPRVSTQQIVAHVMGLSRLELYMNLDRELTPEQLDATRPLVKRRGSGEPLQYILEIAPFRYLDVKVRPGVLIPRPETEVLVSEVLAALPPTKRRIATDSRVNEYDGALMLEEQRAAAADSEGPAQANGSYKSVDNSQDAISGVARKAEATFSESPDDDSDINWDTDDEPVEQPGDAVLFGAKAEEPETETEPEDAQAPLNQEPEPIYEGVLIADICTGSGCIACSMASERPDARVIATDLSPDAVALARENILAANVADRVGVLQGDLGEPIEIARPAFMGKFDAIVSNPPYVPTAILATLPREVADYEPTLALDGGQDGLDLFRRLTPWALRALKPGGLYACELHETCLDEAADIAREAGFATTRIVKDLTGRPRVLVCTTR